MRGSLRVIPSDKISPSKSSYSNTSSSYTNSPSLRRSESPTPAVKICFPLFFLFVHLGFRALLFADCRRDRRYFILYTILYCRRNKPPPSLPLSSPLPSLLCRASPMMRWPRRMYSAMGIYRVYCLATVKSLFWSFFFHLSFFKQRVFWGCL